MLVIASARLFSGVHLSCYTSSALLGQQCLLAGSACLEHTGHRTGAFSRREPFLSQHFCCATVGSDPEPISGLQANSYECLRSGSATKQSRCWGYHGSPAWPWTSQDRGWGWRGQAMPGMSLGNAAEVTLQSGYRHMPLVPARAACSGSWTEGSPEAWETRSGRWPAPTVSSSCLAYAKYNKMH